ncbi:tripartite tricarboxylate transporter TctB family protein [Chelativorans sp. YIM 93263]|uniref:tripartite tricarboxylate transporter TctB family protein n=1 Tax=Chelativorans sp. YIM 93263 TaxID=2906648 RepID=UPI0023782403|nr:tripartite tricarboxylate transporter TctB family protein [Chelativorans sp. YIM 93263]
MSQDTDNQTTPAGEKDWAGAVGSVFFLIVGLYTFVTSFGMSDMAAMFPRTIGAVMAALAVLQILASVTGRSGKSLERGSSVAEQAEGLGRRLVLVAVMAGWALLFPIIGMFVTSFIACVILMATGTFARLSPLRLGILLGTVLVMVTFFYFLMTNVLNIPMPRGLLF